MRKIVLEIYTTYRLYKMWTDLLEQPNHLIVRTFGGAVVGAVKVVNIVSGGIGGVATTLVIPDAVAVVGYHSLKNKYSLIQ